MASWIRHLVSLPEKRIAVEFAFRSLGPTLQVVSLLFLIGFALIACGLVVELARLPAGVHGAAAVYTDNMQIAGVPIMFVIRARSWLIYIF